MLVEDIKDEHILEYTELLDDIFKKKVEAINKIMSDLYAGRTLFQYNINEEVLLNILKNEYGIDAR